MYRFIFVVFLSLTLHVAAAAPAYAGGGSCDPCDPERRCICHNIGGPEDLGANCDMTGTCTYPTDSGDVTVTPNHFLGIIIGFNESNTKALGAHIGHGDGRIVATFDPPLHLAPTAGPHRASNVECLGERVLEQPTEPGN
jgi:hypothetical protein